MWYNVRGAGIILKIVLILLSSHLFNVSGSGKTRLSLDDLCSHWGLYISCKTLESAASGSNDFIVATEMLQSMSSWPTSSPDLCNVVVCARLYLGETCATLSC